MKSVSLKEISLIKMETNPPEVVINSGNRVINISDGYVYEYGGIKLGWVKSTKASREDYQNIPQLI
jgi:hypothetical protein